MKAIFDFFKHLFSSKPVDPNAPKNEWVYMGVATAEMESVLFNKSWEEEWVLYVNHYLKQAKIVRNGRTKMCDYNAFTKDNKLISL